MTMQPLTIGRLAAAAGVNLETVRYYERIKLMPPPARTASGHRVYEAAHIQRLAFIRRARELGFSIEEVRALLALAEPNSCFLRRGERNRAGAPPRRADEARRPRQT